MPPLQSIIFLYDKNLKCLVLGNEMNKYIFDMLNLVDDHSNNNENFKWEDPQMDSLKFSLKYMMT